MRLRPTRKANFTSSSCGGDTYRDRQEMAMRTRSLQVELTRKEDEVATIVLESHMPATESPSPTMKIEMQDMLFQLGFSLTDSEAHGRPRD